MVKEQTTDEKTYTPFLSMKIMADEVPTVAAVLKSNPATKALGQKMLEALERLENQQYAIVRTVNGSIDRAFKSPEGKYLDMVPQMIKLQKFALVGVTYQIVGLSEEDDG